MRIKLIKAKVCENCKDYEFVAGSERELDGSMIWCNFHCDSIKEEGFFYCKEHSEKE